MTMLTDIKVVLVEILTVLIMTELIDTSDVMSLNVESDENTLIQALYIVKLLKSDYLKSMQDNELENNIVDDEANNTCRDDEFNSTTPISYSVPASVSPIAITTQPGMSVTPSEFITSPSHEAVPKAESVLPSHLVPFAAKITTGEEIQNNSTPNSEIRPTAHAAPIENYIYPYNMSKYRRFGDEPQSVDTRRQQTFKERGYRRVGDADPETIDAVGYQTKVPNIPVLPENTTAITSSVQGTSMPKLIVTTRTLEKISLTRNRPNIINTLQVLGKAPKAGPDIRKDFQTFKKNKIARQGSTSGKVTKKEIFSVIDIAPKSIEIEKALKKSTLKIFLKGSTRMRIPFSENNAFCYQYPHNKLCSSGL